MIYICREGELRRQGLNIIHPTKTGLYVRIGFYLRVGRVIWEVFYRHSPFKPRWHFNREYVEDS